MARISPPPGNVSDFNQTWRNWFALFFKQYNQLYDQVNQTHRGCLVTRDTNQSINSATNTAIIFDTANATEVYDTDGIHDLATNPTHLTVPAGVSDIWLAGSIGLAGSATGYRLGEIYKNGVTFPGGGKVTIPVNSASAGTDFQVITPVISVTPGDYFELYVYQNSGGALNYFGQNEAWFSMTIVD